MKTLLSHYREGDTLTITRISGSGRFRTRLMELGFRKGQKIVIVRYAPLKDPMEVQVAGCNVSLRLVEAAMIEVTPADVSAGTEEQGSVS